MGDIGVRWRAHLERAIVSERDSQRYMEIAQRNWEVELFNKIRSLMVDESSSITEQTWDLIMTSEEARQAWINSFTHYSVDYENNYEARETFGDKLLSASIYYLFIGNPQDDVLGKVMKSSNPSDRLTQINKTLASKTFLGPMFRKYFDQLHHYIRCTSEFQSKSDIMEDVFESFIAAIQLSVDKVAWEGRFMGPGFVSVNKFVHWFYTRRLNAGEFDISGRKDFLTYMKEFFEKFYRITTGKTSQFINEDGTKTYTSLFVYQPGYNPGYGHPFKDRTGRTLNAIDEIVEQDEINLIVRQVPEGFAVICTKGPRSNIKDVKMKIFMAIKRHFDRQPTTSQEIREFEDYLNDGKTSFKILRNIIPERDRYDQLMRVAENLGFQRDSIDVDRTEFVTGYTSLILWGRTVDTNEKRTLFQDSLQPVQGTNTNELIVGKIYQWLDSQK